MTPERHADFVVGLCTHVGVAPRGAIIGGHDYACACCIANALRARSGDLIDLDDYEAVNLLWLLRVGKRLGLDTGDWLKQLVHKLEALPCEMREPNATPRDTELRLQHAAWKILGPQDETAWLVERTDAPAPLYMSGRLTWSESANDAVRFARREDAEAFAPVGAAFRVCEHAWVGSNKSADPASANPKSTP